MTDKKEKLYEQKDTTSMQEKQGGRIQLQRMVVGSSAQHLGRTSRFYVGWWGRLFLGGGGGGWSQLPKAFNMNIDIK